MTTLTDDQIVSLCHDPATPVLSAPQCSNNVVRITKSLVAKYGHFVTIHEFRNQKAAQHRLDPDVVNVPTAHRFIEREGAGYIVMDYVEGTTLDLASAKSMAKELSNVLRHIHLQKAMRPGTLGGGPVSGVLWPEHEEVDFSAPADLQRWFEQRSPKSVPSVDLHRHALSLCHLDFNPRNIIMSGDRIYVVDWAAAGYFPKFFDYIVYRFLQRDFCFFETIESFLPPLSEEEHESGEIVAKILQYSQFHVFRRAKVSQNASVEV